MATDLASRVVRWQKDHGRNNLPWQNTQDPYRVWLSEIMLQQTQVATVKGYYARFLGRFENVQRLADAELDEVLALWSGLGYYSRARNLHLCARQVVLMHGGMFPETAEVLQTLPGIGRSTAAAISAVCFGERVAILDGNVKRVLSRVLAFDADLAVSANTRKLWDLAADLLPMRDLHRAMPRYTQGLMDLGAMVCTSRKPNCQACPVADLCKANEQGRQLQLPVKSRKIKRSAQSIWLLWACTKDGHVWLEKRPTPGVWAGLYSLVGFDDVKAMERVVPTRFRAGLVAHPAVVHALTHKELHLHPVQVQLPRSAFKTRSGAWFGADELSSLGLPAPIRKLLAGQ